MGVGVVVGVEVVVGTEVVVGAVVGADSVTVVLEPPLSPLTR